MQLSLRPLLLATGALLLSAQHASAQFIELLTEAPVTVTGTITTTKTTGTSEQKTVTVTTALKHDAILADIVSYLRDHNLIASDAPATGWSLVVVNYAPADLEYVDAGGHLYVVNGTIRAEVPPAKFAVDAHQYRSAVKYKERHLGRYFIDSSGTVTNHVSYNYLAKLSVENTVYTLTDTLTDGFATISYKSKDTAESSDVFFFAISSSRASVRGSFNADTVTGGTPGSPGQGLISLNVLTGAARLVPASTYPGVDTFPINGF